MPVLSYFHRWAALCALLMCAGCVTKTIEPEHIPRVTTSQNSEGVVTLSWASEVGYNYKIYVMNSQEDRQWKPLEGIGMFRGTGRVINVQDKRNPRKPLPWYSVRAERQE